MFGFKMSIFNAFLFVFLSLFIFTKATPLHSRNSALELSPTAGTTTLIDRGTWPTPNFIDELTHIKVNRSLERISIKLSELADLTKLDDIDEAGLSEGT